MAYGHEFLQSENSNLKFQFHCNTVKRTYQMTKARHIPVKRLAMLFAAVLACMMVSMAAMAEEETEYTYEIYYMDDLGDTWYSGCPRAIYIKTDDDFEDYKLSFKAVDDAVEITGISGREYDDIEYVSSTNSTWREVEGGWIKTLSIDTEDESLYGTDLEIDLTKQGTIIGTIIVHLESYEDALYEWIDSYIDEYTTDDMDSFEKMSAVSTALREDFKYLYVLEDTMNHVYLASDPDDPLFLSYRTDSYTSPAILCIVAARIGGFDEINNCYNDYQYGTTDWYTYHYYCSCTIGDETHYYTFCPLITSNQISSDDIEMIDFSDTDSLTLAQVIEYDYSNCRQDSSTCPISDYVDSNAAAWYHDGVHYCLDEGLMTGTSPIWFSPSTATTRSMIVTMLYRLAGEPEVSGTSSFTDVAEGSWYEDAVIWAEQNGIAKGYDTGEFGVSDSVTREQIAAFFYRYAEYAGEDVSASADLSGYPDADEVSDWAEDEISWAVAERLITGQGVGGETYLAPSNDATRSETATILMRFAENVLQ